MGGVLSLNFGWSVKSNPACFTEVRQVSSYFLAQTASFSCDNVHDVTRTKRLCQPKSIWERDGELEVTSP